MLEKETSMEMRLIHQLIQGESQWTYRPDLNTEEKLWNNIKEKLIANNRDKLGDNPYLSDQEFEQVKNQLSFPSFYKAGVFLSGENGKVHVLVKRGVETLDLILFDRNAVCGGSTSYEIIHQFQAKTEDNSGNRDRRFDVSLLFNGLPLIHIELKNGYNASYSDAFRQIKKYINENKFKGVFSMVQMFVISNGADTRYFAASENPNFEFLTNWSKNDDNNTPVNNLFDFSKQVLKIPEAHQMITDYLILDKKKESIILLRPYQIHAIEAIQNASKNQTSGYIWHTTGSGKTLTSYKVARNLVIDLKSVDKTIFLIDRKNLDDKTTDDFKAYAENDTIAVDETDNTDMLEKKLLSADRSMIVTTIQKLQRLLRNYEESNERSVINKREKARNKKVVFVVDECHRTVTKETKANFDAFFKFPLWYGFTGTPIFQENQGSLDATTEQLYGKCLHKYTIKNALKDHSVLPFQVEYKGPSDGIERTDPSFFSSRTHMIAVAKIILEQSVGKFGIFNPRGQSYDALLSTGSIPRAQKYYDLFMEIKEGKVPEIQISDEIKERYPDFPRIAITYSLQENKDDSERNSSALGKDIEDYNHLFGTSYNNDSFGVEAYNKNLSDRLARKGEKYSVREEQLDLVIVADRLLTGFDAPCLSTIFLDRQPQTPHNMIQAFSRTNRIYDAGKKYGYIVTLQSPNLYREKVDEAIKLFTDGGTDVLAPDWKYVYAEFVASVNDLLRLVKKPDDVDKLGPREQKDFCRKIQRLDRTYHDVRGYIEWQMEGHKLSDYGITDEDLQNFVGKYRNILEEIRRSIMNASPNFGETNSEDIDSNYELVSYYTDNITYDYILRLMEAYTSDVYGVVPENITKYIESLAQENPKIAELLNDLWQQVLQNKEAYKGVDLRAKFESIRMETRTKLINEFSEKYCVGKGDVSYLADLINNKIEENDDLPLDSLLANSDYEEYKRKNNVNIPKFKYNSLIRKEIKTFINEDILPLKANY